MSCVLRVSVPNIEGTLKRLSISPYRVENDTAHFNVSDADFNNFNAQVNDAVVFLNSNGADLKRLMSEPRASGELDFAIEWLDVAFQCDTLPSALVCLAGGFGLALTLSHYPVSEAGNAEA